MPQFFSSLGVSIPLTFLPLYEIPAMPHFAGNSGLDQKICAASMVVRNLHKLEQEVVSNNLQPQPKPI